MDNIVIILGDKTSDIKRTLDSHYKEALTVVGAFNTPTEFYEHYKETPLRISRLIVHESSFARDKYTQLENLKKALSIFNVKFDSCYLLISHDKEVKELIDYLKDDDTFINRHKLRHFEHETYTAETLIQYCLDRISRRHFIKTETEFDDIVRVKKDATTTFKLEEDDYEEKSTLVVLDKNAVKSRDLSDKLKNMQSLSNVVSNEFWENNRIIKDIMHIDKLISEGEQVKRFEIDYSTFFLKDKIKKPFRNVYIVTGESRSGKTTMTYGLAKSSSTKSKTLVIDFDFDNLGLSHLTETQADYATVMLLQDFKTNFKNAIRTLVHSNTKLNVIVSNSKTVGELGELSPIALAQLIAYSCIKYYDSVIIDIPIDLLENVVDLIQRSDKLLITVPNTTNALYSVFQKVIEQELVEKYPNTYKMIVPMAMFSQINKNIYLKGENIQALTSKVFGDEVKCTPNLEFGSFDLEDDLMRLMKSL